MGNPFGRWSQPCDIKGMALEPEILEHPYPSPQDNNFADMYWLPERIGRGRINPLAHSDVPVPGTNTVPVSASGRHPPYHSQKQVHWLDLHHESHPQTDTSEANADRHHDWSYTRAQTSTFVPCDAGPIPLLSHLLNADASPFAWNSAIEVDFGANGETFQGALRVLRSHEPAATPSVSCMHIVCDLIPEWPTQVAVGGVSRRVSRSQHRASQYITVVSLLEALYRNLRKPVTCDEWTRLTEVQRNAVLRTNARRRMDPKQKSPTNILRVDCLTATSHFRGLVYYGVHNGVPCWSMDLDYPVPLSSYHQRPDYARYPHRASR